MTLDKKGKKLPKGITYRQNENRYMGRFMYNGQTYTTYGKIFEKPPSNWKN